MKLRRFFPHSPIELLGVVYVLALAALGALAIDSYQRVSLIVEESAESHREVNIAGRQRMLSQRIAFLTTQLIDSPAEDIRRELKGAIDLMESSHDLLVFGTLRGGWNPAGMPENLHNVYFESPYNLDEKVKKHLSNALVSLRTMPLLDPSMRKNTPSYQEMMVDARGELLQSLDYAVSLYEDNANSRIEQLNSEAVRALVLQLGVLILEAIVLFRPLVKRIQKYTAQIEEMARVDDLTGILNRRAFFEEAQSMAHIAIHHQRTLSLLLMDLDDFKQINDKHGHATGDIALRYFVDLVQGYIPDGGLFARVGGEEFALLIQGMDLAAARNIAGRIIDQLNQSEMKELGEQHPGLRITCSIGLAFHGTTNDKGFDINTMMMQADRALYRAKHNGRNRCEYDSLFAPARAV